MNYKEISPYELDVKVCRAIGKEWMLIGAEHGGITNAMTASWGFLGELWNKPAAVCFIRPQRYTFPLVDRADCYSLSFSATSGMRCLHISALTAAETATKRRRAA